MQREQSADGGPTEQGEARCSLPRGVHQLTAISRNVRDFRASGVGLLDWDKSRVEATDLDLAELPGAGLPLERLSVVR